MKKFLIGLTLLNIISFSTMANDGKMAKDSSSYYANAKVVAEQNEFVYVKVSFKPMNAGKLVVTDGLGETLYTEFVAEGNYQKLIKFSLEELPGGIEILFVEKGEIVKQINVNVGLAKPYAFVETRKAN